MSTLQDLVEEIVDAFVNKSTLFTALDVSNEVKKSFPLSRHREVRDIVRSLFDDVISPSGYGRTTIQVTLDDGSQRDAILYHHLSDSWDLDVKYDNQKRSQTIIQNPTAVGPQPLVPATTLAAIPTLKSTGIPGGGTVQTALNDAFANAPVPAPVPSMLTSSTPAVDTTQKVVIHNPPAQPVVITDPKKLWDRLFDGVKLFP